MKEELTIALTSIALAAVATYLNLARADDSATSSPFDEVASESIASQAPRPTSTPTPTLNPIPTRHLLQNDYHIYQTFNNCGPASLSMALTYYDIERTQQELGQQLRPYQNPEGDNDDKSVTLEEMATKAEELGLLAYHRPAGSIEMLQKFVAEGYPVITRTWLKPNDDIGHYRVVKGYDQKTQELIQDDSLQGNNLRYDYDTFNTIWSKFNYEYLVLVPPKAAATANAILGDHVDPQLAWQDALKNAQKELENDPENVTARFNLSVAHYHLGNYQASVKAYEQIASKLPKRTLWYQIEPILAYYELGQTDDVFRITDQILQNENRAFSELYLIRGQVYEDQGKLGLAREQYRLANRYNRNFEPAQLALNRLN